jgi:prolyl-tRNA editing enzyme YbaK/EbsC (Cys-tRNA(Pro) deacylase)
MNCRVSFASAEEMHSLTGMEVGAVTPFGIGMPIPIFIDERVMTPEWIILGAGKRDSKIRISPSALLYLPNSQVVSGLANLTEAAL